MRCAQQAADGGDDAEAPAPAFAHAGDDGVGEVDRPPRHDVHRAFDVLVRRVLGRADLYDTGDVDCDVDRAVLALDLGDGSSHPVAIAHVHDDRRDGTARVAVGDKRVGGLRQGVGGARCEDDAVPGVGEGGGDEKTQPARGSRDECQGLL